MGYVSSETIDAVVERLNGLHERELLALQRRLGPAQPELAAFALAFTHDRGPDVSGFRDRHPDGPSRSVPRQRPEDAQGP